MFKIELVYYVNKNKEVKTVGKSIESVSEELGISKAAIYKKLKKEKYKNSITKENGKMMLSDIVVEELKKNVRKKKKVESFKDIEIVDEENKVEVLVDDKKENKDRIVESLLRQLEEKDHQINKLHDLIENNQIIIKNQQEKEKEQLKLEEHFKEIDKKLFEIRERNVKKNFFKNKFWSK